MTDLVVTRPSFTLCHNFANQTLFDDVVNDATPTALNHTFWAYVAIIELSFMSLVEEHCKKNVCQCLIVSIDVVGSAKIPTIFSLSLSISATSSCRPSSPVPDHDKTRKTIGHAPLVPSW